MISPLWLGWVRLHLKHLVPESINVLCAMHCSIMESYQEAQGAGAQCYMKKDWRNWVFSALRSEGAGEVGSLSSTCKADRARLIWKVHSGRTRAGSKDIKKKKKREKAFYHEGSQKPPRGPRSLWVLYLGDIQNATRTVLIDLLWLDMLWAGGWTRDLQKPLTTHVTD